jgi:hypothetical protein
MNINKSDKLVLADLIPYSKWNDKSILDSLNNEWLQRTAMVCSCFEEK